jgi:hypothetical protein
MKTRQLEMSFTCICQVKAAPQSEFLRLLLDCCCNSSKQRTHLAGSETAWFLYRWRKLLSLVILYITDSLGAFSSPLQDPNTGKNKHDTPTVMRIVRISAKPCPPRNSIGCTCYFRTPLCHSAPGRSLPAWACNRKCFPSGTPMEIRQQRYILPRALEFTTSYTSGVRDLQIPPVVMPSRGVHALQTGYGPCVRYISRYSFFKEDQ